MSRQSPPLAECTWRPSNGGLPRARVLHVVADMAGFHDLLNLSTPFQSPPCGVLPWRSSSGALSRLEGRHLRHLRHRTVGAQLGPGCESLDPCWPAYGVACGHHPLPSPLRAPIAAPHAAPVGKSARSRPHRRRSGELRSPVGVPPRASAAAPGMPTPFEDGPKRAGRPLQHGLTPLSRPPARRDRRARA